MFSNPGGIAIEASGDILAIVFLIIDPFGSTAPAIIRVDPTTGIQSVVSSGGNLGVPNMPSGLAVAADGSIIVAVKNFVTQSGGAIIRVDPVTGAQTVISSGGLFGQPSGVDVDSTGQIFVIDATAPVGGLQVGVGCSERNFAGALFRIDPSSGAQTVISAGGQGLWNLPNALAVEASGSILVPSEIGCAPRNQITRVNPITGQVTALPTQFVFEIGVIAVVRAPSVVPFAAFTAKAEIDFGPLANDDEFEVKSTFTLGTGSDGIDPLTEDVSFQVGTFSTTIPAGSFKFHPAVPGKKGKPGKPARWTFEGVIDGVELEAKITDLGGGSFEFKAEGEGADLTGIANPVTVALTIGDDGGSTTVEAEFD